MELYKLMKKINEHKVSFNSHIIVFNFQVPFLKITLFRVY